MKWDTSFKNKKFIIVFVIIIALVLTADMLSKYLIGENAYPLINGIISIEGGHYNSGAAYSVLEGKVGLLIAFSIIFIALFFVFDLFIKRKNTLYYISFALIVGGALGNLYDRIVFGVVRDFIKLEFINFPIFNIADSCLCVGVFLLVVFLLFFESRSDKNDKKI